jgi:hypothetical protein
VTSGIFVLPSLIESFGMVYAEDALSSAEDVASEHVAEYCVSTMEELRHHLETLARMAVGATHGYGCA